MQTFVSLKIWIFRSVPHWNGIPIPIYSHSSYSSCSRGIYTYYFLLGFVVFMFLYCWKYIQSNPLIERLLAEAHISSASPNWCFYILPDTGKKKLTCRRKAAKREKRNAKNISSIDMRREHFLLHASGMTQTARILLGRKYIEKYNLRVVTFGEKRWEDMIGRVSHTWTRWKERLQFAHQIQLNSEGSR